MPVLLNRFRRDETGATMVEYVLLVALIAIIAATGALALGQNINNFFKGIATYISTVPTNP
jgi:pilus assembly protein Flp/PilA